MKNKRKIIGVLAFCAAVFLVGCGEQSVSETSSSSVESSISSVETSTSSAESSSSSTVESSVDMGDGSTDDIAVIVTDNQDILKSSSTSDTTSDTPGSGTGSSTSDTSTDVSTSEPTSEPTSSSSTTVETSKPTSSSSSSTTSKPSTPVTSTWNPDAPGNKPGPYGGYYDASGKLHAIEANVPLDSYGYPVVTFYAEDGSLTMTKAEKEAYDAETQRLWQGGVPDTSGIDGSKWGFEF